MSTYRKQMLDQVREATSWWMIDYNEARPQDALRYMTPLVARQQSAGNSIYELPS
jgi:putative transposase